MVVNGKSDIYANMMILLNKRLTYDTDVKGCNNIRLPGES